jgi:hypothetical protein
VVQVLQLKNISKAKRKVVRVVDATKSVKITNKETSSGIFQKHVIKGTDSCGIPFHFPQRQNRRNTILALTQPKRSKINASHGQTNNEQQEEECSGLR